MLFEQPRVAAVSDDYVARKLGGVCTYGKCTAPSSADGAKLCPKHRAEQNERQRKAWGKRVAAWKAKGLCTRCGRKRSSTSTWACQRCLLQLGRLRPPTDPALYSAQYRTEQISKRTQVDNDGRLRYRGRDGRGTPPRGETNAQDLRKSIAALIEGAAMLARLETPSVAALPRIQRQDAKNEALAMVALGARFAVEVLAREKHKVDFRPSAEDDGE